MPITKLTKEYLAAFVYIIDLITAEEAELDYVKIADEGVGAKKDIDARTIKRAFELREELAKVTVEKKVYKPSLKTLNTLTAYYFDDTDERFLNISKTHETDIKAHYEKFKPTVKVIETIFPSGPEKIIHLRQQQETVEETLEDLKGEAEQKMDLFLADMEGQIVERFKKINDQLEAKTDLITHLELQIEALQRKLKQAQFMYNTLGALGLFFVSINYDSLDKESLVEDFLDDYEGLVDENVIDDIL
ncbi:hypothetical protein [Maribacter sp. 2307UL18-2]|uniref:hypothetical protein n=1 Tax=Maribacter sp. 2307UL18-2 TaxID=3386274 RepID=UPI0039BCC49D